MTETETNKQEEFTNVSPLSGSRRFLSGLCSSPSARAAGDRTDHREEKKIMLGED